MARLYLTYSCSFYCFCSRFKIYCLLDCTSKTQICCMLYVVMQSYSCICETIPCETKRRQFYPCDHCECVIRTKSSGGGELLVYLLHPFQVHAAGLRMVYHGLGVVDSYDAFCLPLDLLWGVPGIVDVFGREVFQYWQITSVSKNGNIEVDGLETGGT